MVHRITHRTVYRLELVVLLDVLERSLAVQGAVNCCVRGLGLARSHVNTQALEDWMHVLALGIVSTTTAFVVSHVCTHRLRQ